MIDARDDTPLAAADHLVPFGSGEWALWPHVVLRAPGFPAAGVGILREEAIAAAADTVAAAPPEAEDWLAYRAAFEDAQRRVAVRLQEVAALSRFQEAIAWQNHRVFDTAIRPLLKWRAEVDTRPSDHRQHEQLVASYWQRYCVKNDTIGFFGPVGWGRCRRGGGTTVRHGAALVESREVFFEIWTIDALAAALEQLPGMRQWIPPRRVPFVRVAGCTVMMPPLKPVDIGPIAAWLLEEMDGVRPFVALAGEAVKAGVAPTEAAVYEELEALCARRWCVWRLEVPIDPRPELWLRRFVSGVGDPSLVAAGCGALDTFEEGRNAVRTAGSDAAALRTALQRLDSTFGEITGLDASRHHGRTYGGRTLLYHDSRRAVDFDLGDDVIEALEPVELIFQSARWFTHRTSEILRSAFVEVYRKAAQRDTAVDLSTFWFECMPLLHGKAGQEAVHAARRELQRRWAEILHIPEHERHMRYSSAELEPRVREHFDVAHPGWSGARYLSPDVMIAADSVEAIRSGDFEIILGELHLAINSFRHQCFVTQHPRVEELFNCMDGDFPEPRLLPVLPKENPPRLTIRTHPALTRPEDYLVALSYQTADPARPRLLMSSGLTVEERDGAILVRAGDRTYDALDVLSELMMNLIIDEFDMIGDAPHTPRLIVDRVVIVRETWRVDATELPFCFHHDEPRRFVEMRAWQRELGLPSRVFVKSPLEAKPFYVDFESPICSSILAKAVRRLERMEVGRATVRFTEMLPDLRQLWLADGEGRHYCSELRFAAVDRRAC